MFGRTMSRWIILKWIVKKQHRKCGVVSSGAE
jgi:hypothetical protein